MRSEVESITPGRPAAIHIFRILLARRAGSRPNTVLMTILRMRPGVKERIPEAACPDLRLLWGVCLLSATMP